MSNYQNPRFDVNRRLDPVYDLWEWQFDGACRSVDPESFFLEYNERGVSKKKKELKAVALCNTCPVKDQCLEHALKVPEMYGVWGGMTEEQRRIILRKRGVRFDHL